jgi:hypothetical protein
MKKGYILITAAAICALAASALGWGSVVSWFNCPGGSQFPNGVGYRDNYLYITTNQPDRCYRTNFSGSIVLSHSLPTTTTRGCAAGVIGSLAYYWVANNNPRRVYRIGWNSGSIYHSFTPPGTDAWGLAYRQSGSTYYLYYTSSSDRRLYRLNAVNGSVYNTYALAFAPRGIGYGDGYLWIADGAGYIRKCSVTGSTYDRFSVGSYGYVAGCDYDASRNQVWVGFNAPNHRIYRFETSSGTAVTPESMGKIKAAFR